MTQDRLFLLLCGLMLVPMIDSFVTLNKLAAGFVGYGCGALVMWAVLQSNKGGTK